MDFGGLNESWTNAVTAYKNGNYKKAMADLKSTRPSSKIHFNMGMVQMVQLDFLNAVAHFDRALELDDMLAITFFQRGVCYFMTGDYTSAMADWEQTETLFRGNDFIDYNPLHMKYSMYKSELYINYAVAYYYLGDKDSCLKALSQAKSQEKIRDNIDEWRRKMDGGEAVYPITLDDQILFEPPVIKLPGTTTSAASSPASPPTLSTSAPTSTRTFSPPPAVRQAGYSASPASSSPSAPPPPPPPGPGPAKRAAPTVPPPPTKRPVFGAASNSPGSSGPPPPSIAKKISTPVAAPPRPGGPPKVGLAKSAPSSSNFNINTAAAASASSSPPVVSPRATPQAVRPPPAPPKAGGPPPPPPKPASSAITGAYTWKVMAQYGDRKKMIPRTGFNTLSDLRSEVLSQFAVANTASAILEIWDDDFNDFVEMDLSTDPSTMKTVLKVKLVA